MFPRLAFLLAALLLLTFLPLPADDDSPPISITSPDTGTTYAYGDVKSHSLLWNKKSLTLVARVTFTDAELNVGTANEDTHDFRLPGIAFDPAKGVFYATSSKGLVVPVAHYKKTLFFTTIEVLPNANIRIMHPRGNVTVILEAISPDDPAMHPKPADPDGTTRVDIKKILN